MISLSIAKGEYSKYGRDEYKLNGLRYHDNETNSFIYLPLRNINYNISIENNIAKV